MDFKKTTIYILLGGNLGDVPFQFKKARTLLENKVGKILKESKLYQSEPWGFESKNHFLNQVIEIQTNCSPIEVLDFNQEFELELGRQRTPNFIGFESRVIDIDLLYYDSLILHSNRLTVPHYALHERRFTLQPLVEIAPNYLHPSLNKTNTQLLNDCVDQSIVTAI